ncbi:MAG: hypothetical protein VKJ02_07050 [Snowella sp.]|nr:hypothetical protein [Snowella sp.]
MKNDATKEAQTQFPDRINSLQENDGLLAQSGCDTDQETLYLQSIAGLVESIRQAEQADDWVSEEEFMQELML